MKRVGSPWEYFNFSWKMHIVGSNYAMSGMVGKGLSDLRQPVFSLFHNQNPLSPSRPSLGSPSHLAKIPSHGAVQQGRGAYNLQADELGAKI